MQRFLMGHLRQLYLRIVAAYFRLLYMHVNVQYFDRHNIADQIRPAGYYYNINGFYKLSIIVTMPNVNEDLVPFLK